jgi:putative membrane protein
MWHWGDGFGWGLGMLGMAVFWIVVIVALVWVARLVWDRGGPRESSRPPETPLEILQRRYARGEIDRAEYEEKRRDLQ